MKDYAYEKAVVVDVVYAFSCKSISSKSVWQMKLIIFPPCQLSAHPPLDFLFLRMKLSVWQVTIILETQASGLSSFQIIYYPTKAIPEEFLLAFFSCHFFFLFSLSLIITSLFHIGDTYLHELNAASSLRALVNNVALVVLLSSLQTFKIIIIWLVPEKNTYTCLN